MSFSTWVDWEGVCKDPVSIDQIWIEMAIFESISIRLEDHHLPDYLAMEYYIFIACYFICDSSKTRMANTVQHAFLDHLFLDLTDSSSSISYPIVNYSILFQHIFLNPTDSSSKFLCPRRVEEYELHCSMDACTKTCSSTHCLVPCSMGCWCRSLKVFVLGPF